MFFIEFLEVAAVDHPFHIRHADLERSMVPSLALFLLGIVLVDVIGEFVADEAFPIEPLDFFGHRTGFQKPEVIILGMKAMTRLDLISLLEVAEGFFRIEIMEMIF